MARFLKQRHSGDEGAGRHQDDGANLASRTSFAILIDEKNIHPYDLYYSNQ
jgi:hypothetical protein